MLSLLVFPIEIFTKTYIYSNKTLPGLSCWKFCRKQVPLKIPAQDSSKEDKKGGAWVDHGKVTSHKTGMLHHSGDYNNILEIF
jgi:hypothetical protein